MAEPELIPGLEDFWAPDQSAETIQREVESLPPKFAASRSAKYDYGVVYRGQFETVSDGVCVAVRRNACALRRAKLPVFLQSPNHLHWNNGVVERAFYSELPPAILAEVDHLTDPKHGRTVAWIEHFVPSLERLISLTEPGPLTDAVLKPIMLKSTAAFIALEHDVVPATWIERLDMFGRVIVPCDANKKWLLESGLQVPIDVVVHPLGLKDPMRQVKASYRTGTYRFLHVGKWEPRKNQHVLIGAFLTAFAPSDDVELVLKCTPYWRSDGYPPTADVSMEYWSKKLADKGWTEEQIRKHVRVIWNQHLSRQDMSELYASCHAYVQSGRSEGFDLCALDAKVAGLRVVGVFWGGPSQFQTPQDITIPWIERKAPPEGYNAPDGVRWPAPTVRLYADALHLTFITRGAVVEPFDVTPYLLDTVGAQLRETCRQLAAYVGVDLSDCKAE